MTEHGKALFSDHVESFAAVVDALVRNPRTRTAFELDPMGTLEQYGIKCPDADLRARLAKKLTAASARAASGQVGMQAVAVPFVVAVVAVEVVVTIGPENRGKDLEQGLFEIDRHRVDMFLDGNTMQERIAVLEDEVMRLRAELARR